MLPGSEVSVWWQCAQGHEWQAQIRSRVQGSGCPVCSNYKLVAGINDLTTLYPQLAGEWHPTRNGTMTPEDVTPGSKRKVWWRCQKGHEWCASIQTRVLDNTGYPVCSGRIVQPGENDLATRFPEIAQEWHLSLNGSLTPQMVTAGSHKKVWWICRDGHVWKAFVYSRTGKQQRGCPVYAGVVSGKRKLRYVKMMAEIRDQPDLHSHKTRF